MAERKVKVIRDSLTPKLVHEVRSFHELTIFYRYFVKYLSTLVIPLNEVVKKSVRFKWREEHELTFSILKEKLCLAPILALHDFMKTFEIECDESR